MKRLPYIPNFHGPTLVEQYLWTRGEFPSYPIAPPSGSARTDTLNKALASRQDEAEADRRFAAYMRNRGVK